MSSMKRPSSTTDGYWILARGPKSRRGPGLNPGKWLIFVSRTEIDASWERVVKALGEGLLGPEAKVSTARPNPNSSDPSKHVICVYTHDGDDEADVRRVRAALRDIGITAKISYKTDAATLAGRYENRGSRRISKYWE